MSSKKKSPITLEDFSPESQKYLKEKFGGRVPTEEELVEVMKSSLANFVTSLEKKWKNMPEDPKERKRIIDAAESTSKLIKKLRNNK